MVAQPRPLTTWYGGKARMAKIIADMLPKHINYVEPFCGMSGVLMAKPPSEVELINDMHDGLINLYRVIRNPDTCKELIAQLELTPYARAEWRYCNDNWQTESCQVEKARMVYITLAQNFVGKTSNGSWSFGGPECENVVKTFVNSLENISLVCKRMQSVMIENKPALNIMRQWENSNTCFYLDPPYLPEVRHKGAARDYLHEMSLNDHMELLDFCLNSKSKIILSGYLSRLYQDTLECNEWQRKDYQMTSSAALQSTANGLKGKPADLAKRTECLWINPAAQGGQLKLWA